MTRTELPITAKETSDGFFFFFFFKEGEEIPRHHHSGFCPQWNLLLSPASQWPNKNNPSFINSFSCPFNVKDWE